MTAFSSDRLHYRELCPEDVTQAYVDWLNDPGVNRYLEIRFAEQQTDESVRAFVAAQQADPDTMLLRISLAGTDIHIGNIKLGPVNRHHNTAQVSLLIGDRTRHGKGYASEAIGAVTRWGLDALGLARIEGGCYADNLGSLRAFLKNGYVVEGFRRNAVIDSTGKRQGVFLFVRLADDGQGHA